MILMAYLKPILPGLASKTEVFLNCAPLDWSSISQPLLQHKVNSFKPMLQRLETKKVEKLITNSKPQIDQDNQMSASDAEIERHIEGSDQSSSNSFCGACGGSRQVVETSNGHRGKNE